MKKFTLLLSALAFAASAAWAADTVDVTNLVQTSKDAWHGSGVYGNVSVNVNGQNVNMVEHYFNGDIPVDTKVLYQDIEVANGTYEASIYATAFNAWRGDPYITGPSDLVCDFYAMSALTTERTPIHADKQTGYTVPGEYTVTIEVTDGKLQLGMITNQFNACEWFTIQIKSLLRHVSADEALAGAKAAATEALESSDFDNVTGNERAALQQALTTEGITAEQLQQLTSIFKAARTSYDNFVAAKAQGAAAVEGSLAASDKIEALETALATTPAVAQAAQAAADAIIAARLAVITSDAVAEGVEGRVVIELVNPTATDGTNGWTLDKVGTSARMRVMDSERPVDANGIDYKYFDSDNWGDGSWKNHFYQMVELPAGKYRLAVMARGSAGIGQYYAKAGDATVDLTHTGSAGGDYGRGFNEHVVDFVCMGGEVEISVNTVVTVSQQWQSFTNFRLTKIADLENPEKEAYEAAVAAAWNVLEDEQYINIFGEEYDTLEALLDEDEPTTTEGYAEATQAINAAVDAFVSAKPAYDAYAAATEKAWDIADSCTDASDEALSTLIDMELPLTADEAEALVPEITAAYRLLLHSHSMAEGIEGAVDCTHLIVNPKAENNIEGWTLAQGDGGGGIGTLSNEVPTYHDGSTHGYFDGGNWNGSDWTTRFEQTIPNLPEGNYRLSVVARGSENLRWFRLRANTANVDLNHSGAADDAHFGKGWMDHNLDFEHAGGDLLISVQANSQQQHQWHSFTNFRLVRTLTPTGVENVAVDATDADEATFDIMGRRINNPEAGLYIKGGKKVYIRK